MKLLPRFDCSQSFLWMGLLVVALLVAGPLYASEEESGVSGKITQINLTERFIEVNSVQYKMPLKVELQDVSGSVPKIINITELKVGQYVEFQVIGNTVKSLQAFEMLPE